MPDRLLNKPGALTADEVVEMRKHPAHGRDVIVHAERDVGAHDDAILAMAKDIVYTHHEKWDGTGYPAGPARHGHPDCRPADGARRRLRRGARARRSTGPDVTRRGRRADRKGRGTHFDPAVVDAFLKVSGAFEDVSMQKS